jgi:selenocysteine lyase/cysteine desulfurase
VASSALLDFAGRGVGSWTRASVHAYNTEAELDEFLGVVAALARAPVPA